MEEEESGADPEKPRARRPSKAEVEYGVAHRRSRRRRSRLEGDKDQEGGIRRGRGYKPVSRQPATGPKDDSTNILG